MKKIYICLMSLILAFTGVILSACGKTYDDMKIELTGNAIVENCISLAIGEDAEIECVVSKLPENAIGGVYLSPSSNIINAEVTNYNKDTCVSTIKITALAFGNCFLRVTTLEGNKFADVDVKVSLAIEDYNLKDDLTLYAVRGTNNPKNLILSSDFFNFTPTNTSQTAIDFYDENDNLITEIDATNFEKNNLTIKAKSPFLPKIIDIPIQIIDEISAVDVFDMTESKEQLYSKEQNQTDTLYENLYFISNRKDLARKTLRLEVSSGDNNKIMIERSVKSSAIVQCSEFDLSTKKIENNKVVSDFDLQSLNQGSTTIEFKVFYQGYEKYAIFRTYEIFVEEAPNKILLNDQEKPYEQILFDGAYSTVRSIQNISIFPSTSIFDEIIVEAVTEVGLSGVATDYVNFTVGGLPLFESGKTKTSISNLELPIVARGIKDSENTRIKLNFSVKWGEKQNIVNTEEISTSISYIVKTGASAIAVEDKYNVEDLYISLEDGCQTFNGFYVNNTNAYVENSNIYCLYTTRGECLDIVQLDEFNLENKKYIPLSIKPLQAGVSKWRIVLPNGVFKDFNITVVEKLENLTIDVDQENSSYISKLNYSNNNLIKVDVKLDELENSNYSATIALLLKTNPSTYNLNNEKLFDLQFESYDETEVFFDKDTLTMTINTNDPAGFNGQALNYSIAVKNVEDFKLIKPESTNFSGVLSINAYIPLANVKFSKPELNLYSKSVLGHYYTELCQGISSLMIDPDKISLDSNLVKISLSSSLESTYNAGLLTITNTGFYDLHTGVFTLEYSGRELTEPIYVYANVEYYNETYIATLKINILKYIQVSEIRTTNYIPQIYLSSTITSQDIYTYILPQDATHKELICLFIPNSGYNENIINIETIENGFRMSYGNNGGGQGMLIIYPKSSVSVSSPLDTPSNALKIPVYVGDGTKDNPLKISTATELLRIGKSGLDKHYIITSVIDLTGYDFEPFEEFSGSIDGKNIGSITGIVLDKTKIIEGVCYGGLFTKLSGTISNLQVYGSINLKINSSSNIGLIAGELTSTGRLENVGTILNSSSIKIQSSDEVSIGGVVGLNKGTIITTAGKDYVNYNLIDMTSPLTIIYSYEGNQDTSYLGGVTGNNKGVIKRHEKESISLYNNQNYLANVKISVVGANNIVNSAENTKFMIGGLAGENSDSIIAETSQSTLDNENYSNYIKLSGIITLENQACNYLGGIVGINNCGTIKGVVTRIKLRSLAEMSANKTITNALLGGMVALNYGGGDLENCVIQAVDDGTSLAQDLAVIYSASFGLKSEDKNGKTIYSLTSSLNMIGAEQESDTSSLRSISPNNNLTGECYITREKVELNIPANYDNYYGCIVVGTKNGYYTTSDNFTEKVAETLVMHDEISSKLLTDDDNASLMAYLKYYEAKDVNDQNLLQAYNTQSLPFAVKGEVSIVSYNNSIISILANGKLQINGKGIVRLKIISNLNRKISTDVYVYVVGVIDSCDVYISSSQVQENAVVTGTMINVYEGKSTILSAKMKAKDVLLGGYGIELVPGTEMVLYDDSTNLADKSVKFSKLGDIYLLEAISEPGTESFTLKGSYSIFFNDAFYYINDLAPTIIFNAQHLKGAEKITSKYNTYNNIEPLDEFEIKLEITTDYFDEKLSYECVKFGDEYKSSDYFIVEETARKYQVSAADNAIECNKPIPIALTLIDKSEKNMYLYLKNGQIFISDTVYESIDKIIYKDYLELNDLVSIKLDADKVLDNDKKYSSIYDILKLNKLNIDYVASFNKEHMSNDYQGKYFINFSAINDDICYGVELNIVEQSLDNILVNSFSLYDEDQNLTINSGTSTNNYLSPNSPNYLNIEFEPIEAEYDYAEIVWSSDNANLRAMISWIGKDGVVKSGAALINKGLRFDKSIISNLEGNLLIRYDVGSLTCKNGDVLKFDIKVYKENQVILTQTRNITIKFSIEVSFEIEGKTVYSSDENELVYLVKGKSYSFVVKSEGYLENEIVMTNTRKDIVTTNLKEKTITISSDNFIYPSDSQGINGYFTIYGIKKVYDKTVASQPYNLNFVIVDIEILPKTQSEEGVEETHLVKDVYSNLTSVALGNTYPFLIELVNNYNSQFNSDLKTVMANKKYFQNELTKEAIWEYQIGTVNADGTYDYSEQMWIAIDDKGVSAQQSGGWFIISGTKNSGFVFSPLKIHSADNPAYKFRVKYAFEYLIGKPSKTIFRPEDGNTDFNRIEEWSINVYQFSSIDAPTPINNYNDFIAMKENSYYILMNDIALPADYQPITTAIGGLDGNNKKIIINANNSFENLDSVGIFSKIETDAIVRNLKIEIQNNVRWSVIETGATNYVGILAGENAGIITNVSVTSLDGASFKLVFSSNDSTNYVGGLVGLNTGFVTNSRVKLFLTTAANLAGFVAYNEGNIANCYASEIILINTTNVLANKTAGFVVYNATDETGLGKIINSYVSGVHSGVILPIYSNNESLSIIRSSTEVAGFVYQNNGKISDSYSDIPILSSSKNAGFVFENVGTVQNTFSTCKLKSNSQESYGFVCDNSQGTIIASSYLSDSGFNFSINNSNKYIEGLKIYNIEDYSNPDNFNSFTISKNGDISKGIWFFPQSTFQGQLNNMERQFSVGRLELLGPNIIVESSQVLDMENTVIDPETGEITYAYRNNGDFAQGSLFNPYIIISAKDFESKILSSNNANINTNNFRLVSNIDYQEEGVYNTNLFKTIFLGDIEGNGMKIGGYVIDETARITSAGLFSAIGNGSSDMGSVKNLILSPKYINLPNANCVGALAGTLNSGTISNVVVDGETNEGRSIVVLGKNIVGGLVGRAIGLYQLHNVNSTISANAIYRSNATLQKDNISQSILSYFLLKTHSAQTLSLASYSGAIAGVLAGTGVVSYANVDGNIASMSEFAGLMFGGIGNGVKVENIDLKLKDTQFIQASVYGGVVAGECYGTIQNVSIQSDSKINNLFTNFPFKPYAVGGIVGLFGTKSNIGSRNSEHIGTGLLKNITVSTSISCDIDTIGGIVGEMIGGEIKNSKFTSDINGVNTVGGIVGQIRSMPTANIKYGLSLSAAWGESTILENVYFEQGTLSVKNDDLNSSVVGGLIGSFYLSINDMSQFRIVNSFAKGTLSVISDIFGGGFNVYVADLIGKVEIESFADGQRESQTEISFKKCYMLSNVVIKLRDFKGELNSFYNINYGDAVAKNGDTITLEFEEARYLEFENLYGEVATQGTDKNAFSLIYLNKDGVYTSLEEEFEDYFKESDKFKSEIIKIESGNYDATYLDPIRNA